MFISGDNPYFIRQTYKVELYVNHILKMVDGVLEIQPSL